MPLITLAMAVLITFGLIKFAVPKFTGLFNSLNTELPLPTKVLISVSNFMESWMGWISIIMVGAFAIGIIKVIRTKKGKSVWDRIKLKLPLFGNLILKRSIMSFASTLALLLRAGVDYLTALDIVKNTADNEVIRKLLEKAEQSISRGEKLSEPFIESDIIPPLVTQMIRSGEEAGRVDDMLGKLAALYEREVDQSAENLSSALQPILTLILAGLILSVLLGLYMPIFKSTEALSGM